MSSNRLHVSEHLPQYMACHRPFETPWVCSVSIRKVNVPVITWVATVGTTDQTLIVLLGITAWLVRMWADRFGC